MKEKLTIEKLTLFNIKSQDSHVILAQKFLFNNIMKSLAYILGIIFTFFSCTSGTKISSKATLITYELEDLSLEGTIAEVYYNRNKIKKSITTLYGESGKAIVTYDFLKDRIKVNEIRYQYHADLENLDQPGAVELAYDVNYVLDLNGNRKDKTKDHWFDIFDAFKAVVPFRLE